MEIQRLVAQVAESSGSLADAMQSQQSSNQQTIAYAKQAGDSYSLLVESVTHIRQSMAGISQESSHLSGAAGEVSQVIHAVADSARHTQTESGESIQHSENLAAISKRFAKLTNSYQIAES